MRTIAISAFFAIGAITPAAAQVVAGGPQALDCRPIATVETDKGVSITRGFRAKDKAAIGTIEGYRCYAAPAPQVQAPAPSAQSRQTIIILNGGLGLNGFNVGTSPNVLGAPQPRRF
ncbi:MAG: hypothetical protein AAFR41_07940 [Pseudomonadota bacterium]